MAVATGSPATSVAAFYSSGDSASSRVSFRAAHCLLNGRRLSCTSASSCARFGSVLSVSSNRRPHPCTQIRALDPDFYKIPYVEGIPVGNRLKLWNLPPNCDHGELREWLDSIPDVNVTALEFTDDPELNSQGVGGFVEFTTKQEACMAIVRLDGRKLKGRCIRMDFVEKRPHEREIGGRRNRPSRNYPRDRSYSGGSYSGDRSFSGGSYSGSSYGGSAMYGAPNSAAATPSAGAFDPNANAVSPNWAAPPPSPPPPPPQPRAYGPTAHRIFVGNLSWNLDDNGLFSLFRNHGNVLEARVMRDRDTGSSRGFGFVAMSTAEEMNSAIAALNGAIADGRALKVSVASR